MLFINIGSWDTTKFIFSRVKKSARAKDLEDALEWLIHDTLYRIKEYLGKHRK